MKYFYFFLYGFSSIFIQTYFLREIIFLGGGNELNTGFFFFFWFLGIFFGAISGKNYKKNGKFYIYYLAFFPFSSFLIYFFVFLLNYFFPIPLGGEPQFLRAFFTCSGISFFTGFYVGFLFPLSLLFQRNLPLLFFYESLGSFIAGISLSLFFLKILTPFKGILILSILFFLFSPKKLKYLLILPLIFINFEKNFNQLRYKSIGILGKVEKEISSPYQNIILSSLKETKSIYLNGRFFAQYPSKESVKLRYFPFLLIPEKLENVIFYGFPLGNEDVLRELNLKNIKIIEPDLFLIKEIKGKDGYYLEEDPRVFLKKEKNKFDLILMDNPPPLSILSSRLSTVDFFEIVRDSLNKKGIFIFYLNLPQDFLGKEMEKYSSSLYYSLKKVFPEVKIGISENPFFISSFEKIEIEESLQKRKFIFEKIKDFSPEILGYFFPEEKVNYFLRKIEREKQTLNFDLKPFFFLEILKIKSKMEKDYLFYNFFSLPGKIFLILIIIPVFYLKRKRRIHFPVVSNGFIGIGLYLILSFIFQAKYGIFYSSVGFLTSLFMLGLSISSPLANFLFKKRLKLLFIEIFLILYLFSLFLINEFNPFLFYLFFFLAGMLSGLPFTFIGLLKGGDQKAGGDMEAQDHLGASFGALVVGIFLVPFLGVYNTLTVFIFLKIYSLLLNLKTPS